MGFEEMEKIFNPKTIAVVGASSSKGHVGYSILKNLLSSGYEGTVYPVNHKRKSVQGVKAYPSVLKVPDKVDLAIVATPAKTVSSIIEECGESGIKGVVIISSGFKESGEEGNLICDSIMRTARKYGIRIVGPNCLGFLKPSLSLNASFARRMPKKGKIAFISQSGALGTAILDWAIENNVGFSHFISIGSMLDVGFNDLIDYFGRDPGTTSILIYMESLNHAKKFLSAARAFARTKPIIVLKVGKSIEGSKAAMSHTGSITGNDDIFGAAFDRAGIIRVDTIGQLFDCAQNLSMQKRPKGKKLAIVTNAGGPGVIATDSLMEEGGKLARLSKENTSKMNKFLPKNWSKSNPVDILGDASPEDYRKSMKLCLEDPDVDGLLVILTPQSMTRPEEVAREVVSLPRNKTILASWMGEKDVEKSREILKNGNVPVYSIPENAIKCFMKMHSFERKLKLLYETPATIPHAFRPDTKGNRELIEKIVKEKRYVLTEEESKKFLSNYQIPVTKTELAKNESDAVRKSNKIGFPVAMKLCSPDIIHKTDVGGVVLNVKNPEEVRKNFKDILRKARKKIPKARIKGVIVEEMASKRHELLIGCRKDPIFGPAIVFGMGGVSVEIFKDTTVGLPPLNMALSMRMIEKTKIYELLKGYRNMKGVDIKSIQFLLYEFAYLVMDFPEIKEIDINPFSVDEDGGIVLDAKVILDKKIAGKKIKPYSHLVISPYPKEYVKKVRMKNGKWVTLRPIKPEDEPMEGEMFTKFSEETQRFRFFHSIKDITHEMLTRYTQIDYDREMAIIAEVKENKKRMAGVARIISDPFNDTAEFAIVVADPWQRQGLGSKLTDYILEISKKRGIKKVYAEMLKDNYVMKRMLLKRGFKVTEKDDFYHAELSL